MLLFRFSISGIAFCKRGVIFPCLQKAILFLSPWQYSHQVNYYLSCECIALSFYFLLPEDIFLSQREDVFNLPVKTQKKIC